MYFAISIHIRLHHIMCAVARTCIIVTHFLPEKYPSCNIQVHDITTSITTVMENRTIVASATTKHLFHKKTHSKMYDVCMID